MFAGTIILKANMYTGSFIPFKNSIGEVSSSEDKQAHSVSDAYHSY